MVRNPFDINKAVDYNDEDLYKYWVNINLPAGFNAMVKPDILMPMIIVGSKGSGKTHVMKYYSYELQKIRLKQTESGDLKDSFEKESFIGVYMRFSGMNANVFSGQGVSDETWLKYFAYYWELFIGETVLAKLIDMQENGLLGGFDEVGFVGSLMNEFLNVDAECKTLIELSEYLNKLQKLLQYEIHNFKAFDRTEPMVEIKLPVSTLTYGIPNSLKIFVPYFKDRHILYLFDEYENIDTLQQQVIQTLLREKPTSCSIRIGTRPYGIRTLKTINGIEENIEGSEFEILRLDDELRSTDRYMEFMENICISRLKGVDINLPPKTTIGDYIDNLPTNILLDNAKHRKSTYNVNKNLRKDLKKYKLQKLSEDEINVILELLSFPDDLVIERVSIELLYKKIKGKSVNLEADARDIRKQAEAYYRKEYDKDNDVASRLSYYRRDIIDGIARSAHLPIPYYGFDTLVELSCGTPRTLLRLLKNAFSKQYFNTGEMPFIENNTLCIESQQAGIEGAYAWFYEENRIPNDEAGVTDVVRRMGKFLQNVRFSDLPPQCSIGIFSVNEDNLSPEARKSLQTLLMYSYLVPHGKRRKKNFDNTVSVYKLNSILIPQWELSLEKRGNVELNAEDAEMIFNPAKAEEYEQYLKAKLKAYNFPFTLGGNDGEPEDLTVTKTKTGIVQLDLFGNGL